MDICAYAMNVLCNSGEVGVEVAVPYADWPLETSFAFSNRDFCQKTCIFKTSKCIIITLPISKNEPTKIAHII